jgi:hypothetical protein
MQGGLPDGVPMGLAKVGDVALVKLLPEEPPIFHKELEIVRRTYLLPQGRSASCKSSSDRTRSSRNC